MSVRGGQIVDSRRRVPVYSFLSKDIMFMDAEREPMMILLLVCVTLVFAGLSFMTTVVGASLWVVGAIALRMMGKVDPKLFAVFLRYVTRYSQPVYLASVVPSSLNNYVSFDR